MDHVRLFRWVIGHIPRKPNPAANYHYRMHDDPKTPLFLTMQARVPAHDIIIGMNQKMGKGLIPNSPDKMAKPAVLPFEEI